MVDLGRMGIEQGFATPPAGRRGAFGWIETRLGALAEDLAAAPFEGYDWQAMIFLGEAGIELYARRKGAVRRVASLGAVLNGEAAEAIRRHFAGLSTRRLVLTLGQGRAIRQTVMLPDSAGDVLSTIIRNKVESLAPWPAGAALWGMRRRKSAESDKIAVDVAIAGRRSVESALSCLAAAGLNVDHVEAAETPEAEDRIAIGFRGEREAARRLRRMKFAAATFAIAAGAAALFGSYLAFARLSEMDEIERRTSALQERLQARQGTGALSGKAAEAMALVERKRGEAPVMDILAALTAAMPDGVWLETLDLAGGKMTFTGRGQPSPAVIEALEMSPLFSNVDFAAAVQRGVAGDAESFSISASIEPKGHGP